MKANPNIIRATLLMAVATAAAIGCARPKAPGVEEMKAIAEEAYIYGLPLVMNYAVMHDFAINRNSGQFKAPFNQIANEARVFTHQDTAVIVPNSDTPYSTVSLDLRAEPNCCCRCRPSSRAATTPCSSSTATPSTTVTSAVVPPGVIQGTTWSPAPDGQARRRRASVRCSGRRREFSLAIFRTQLFGPARDALSVQKGAGPGTARNRSRPISARPPRPPRPGSTSRRSTSRSS